MRFILRFFAFLFSAGAVVFCIAAAVGAFFYWKYSQDLPDHAALANYEPPVMTRVHAADGSLLAEYAHERRLYLPIQAMPKIVVAAFLSAEDKNFYKHGGIDPEGIVRAVPLHFPERRHQCVGHAGVPEGDEARVAHLEQVSLAGAVRDRAAIGEVDRPIEQARRLRLAPLPVSVDRLGVVARPSPIVIDPPG